MVGPTLRLGQYSTRIVVSGCWRQSQLTVCILHRGQQVVLPGHTDVVCICSPEACLSDNTYIVSQQMHQLMCIGCLLPHLVCIALLVM